MRKIISLGLIMVLSLLTFACVQTPQYVDITLESELSVASLLVSPQNRVSVNTNVTITASSVEGYTFLHWYDKENQVLFSLNQVHTFKATNSITLEAIYQITIEETFIVTLDSNLLSVTLIRSSEGPIETGAELTLTAPSVEGYHFLHWLDLDTDSILSTESVYTFTVNIDRNLRAVYAYSDAEGLNIYLSTNIEGSPFILSHESPYELGQVITLEASIQSGYRFEHWKDLDTGLIVSKQNVYAFAMIFNRRLEAVYMPDTQGELYIYSNIELFDYQISAEGPYLLGTTVTITADSIPEYRFKHWYDYGLETILTTSNHLEITMDDSYYLIAVYEHLEAASLIYETGFEDATKTAYAPNTLLTNQETWMFYNALAGNHANEKVIQAKAARIGTNSTYANLTDPDGVNGFIQPVNPFIGLTTIEFMAARYGDDINITMKVMISGDNETWLTIASGIELTANLQNYSFELDYTSIAMISAGITFGTPVYFRITNTSLVTQANDHRLNIDEVKLYAIDYVTPPLPIIEADDDLVFPNNSSRLTLSFSEGITYYYSYQEPWESAHCVAIDIILGEMDCMVYGSVNTNQLGEYQVTYYALDADGYYASVTINKVVLRDASYLDYSYEGTYYEGIEGLYGEALLLALREILQTTVKLQAYDTARIVLEIADRDPLIPSNVLVIYDRLSIVGTWDATSWHREHVWPNSRLGIPSVSGSSRNIGSDIHNLRAIIPATNSSRGNLYFDNNTSGSGFYPREDRGDVARIYFYMVTMWEHLVLTDDLPTVNEPTYTVEGAMHGFLSVLLMFHYDDLVDSFEVNRNQVIYTYQENRNPFIDYPYLVELIWYNHPVIESLLGE